MTKKQKQRLRRRRRRRFFWRVRQITFLVACIMLILALGSTVYHTILFHGKTKVERQVLKHKKDYPKSLLDFMNQNDETGIDIFVSNYEKYKDKHFKISLAGDYKKDTIPYLVQWDKRWGYETFDDTYFGISGSAPTCLSMVAVGLSEDLNSNPFAIGQYITNNGYLSNDHKLNSDFMTEGIEYFDITGTKTAVNQSTMKKLIQDGSPLIAKLKEPVFLEREHYIVIYGFDKKGNFMIYDPASKTNSKNAYSFEELKNDIDTVWAYTLI